MSPATPLRVGATLLAMAGISLGVSLAGTMVTPSTPSTTPSTAETTPSTELTPLDVFEYTRDQLCVRVLTNTLTEFPTTDLLIPAGYRLFEDGSGEGGGQVWAGCDG